MPTDTIKNIKNIVKENEKNRKSMNAEHRRVAKAKVHDNLKDQTDSKIKGIKYFENLSDSEKLAFKKEIQRKEIRDSYVKYVKYIYKEEYVVTPFHAFLCALCENVVKRLEKGQKVKIMISCPPQHGKGYPIDTPILTTKGWKNHGDLVVGDCIYNDKGEQIKVLGTQTPYMHKCLKVNFANGESHIVTREHLWKVYLEKENRENGKHKNIRYEKVIETQELMKILPKCRRSPYVLINEPLKNDYKKLPIAPYVLGLWLGDGISQNNTIVCGDSDLGEELNAIGDSETYFVYKAKGNPNVSYIKLGKCDDRYSKKHIHKYDFTQKLYEMNLLNNKHIPTEYLLASEEQRWELLRGLMDTDGCCDIHGSCEFCNTNKELAYNVYTLLHSLGIKARISEYDAKLYGRFISKKYRVAFAPNKTDLIFHIGRKQERLTNKIRKDREDKFKYFIKSIEEVEDRLVSCINVEGGMYLAGKELIPTHNSASITETLPSWFLGRNPNKRCIVTAYNADIAEKFGDRNRQKVKDYGKELFGVEISDSQDNKTLWDIKGNLGGMYATGLNGSLTSNNGALIIVDDPFKNEVEALNKAKRDEVWSNFSSSVLTRQRGFGNAIIIIQTRWHEDDLIGRILASEIAEEWVYINIPCVWESGVDKILHRRIGETLCPQLGFDTKWAESMRKTIGDRMFSALYQGQPFTEGGDIVKRAFLKFFNKATLPSVFEEITMSCDLSLGAKTNTSDPNGIAIFGRIGGNHYLIDYCIKKMTFTETLDRIRYFCGKYPQMKKKIIESKANGNATMEILNKEIGGFVGYDPKMNSKETRLQLCLPYIESGNLWLPDETYDRNFETHIQELLKFPKATHDEIVDIITQYLLNYEYKYSGKILTDSNFVNIAKAIRGLKI